MSEKTITQIREERIQMESEIKAAIEKFIESNPEYPPTEIKIEISNIRLISGVIEVTNVGVKSAIKI